jgi:Mn-dependent DtxR family transcriptional regulator
MNKDTEHYINQILDYNEISAKAVTIEQIQQSLKVKSGHYFASKNDDLAIF